jgi:chaperonin GroES
MPIKPIQDVVVCTREEANQGGLIQLAGVKEHIGRVVAVGPGLWRQGQDGNDYLTPCTVKPGDRVIFSFRAGMEERIEGNDYLVMRERDIMAVLDDDLKVETENAAEERGEIIGRFNATGGVARAV